MATDDVSKLIDLIISWTERLNDLDARLKGNPSQDYVAIQAEYIRLQKCTIQAQNVILGRHMVGEAEVPVDSDVAVVLPESVI